MVAPDLAGFFLPFTAYLRFLAAKAAKQCILRHKTTAGKEQTKRNGPNSQRTRFVIWP